MHHRAPRARRTVLAVAVPIGLVTSLALTWGSTQAAFYASTGNENNSWQTGSVVLDHSARGSALFASADDVALKPGLPPRSRCIRLDYTGSLQADIRMYVGPSAGATALDPYLVMSVERGTDVNSTTTVAADCTTGFTSNATPTYLDSATHTDAPAVETSRTLAHLRTQHANYDNGIAVNPATAPNTYMTLKITYSLKDDNGAQNKQSSATFTWEARNTP